MPALTRGESPKSSPLTISRLLEWSVKVTRRVCHNDKRGKRRKGEKTKKKTSAGTSRPHFSHFPCHPFLLFPWPGTSPHIPPWARDQAPASNTASVRRDHSPQLGAGSPVRMLSRKAAHAWSKGSVWSP